MRPLTSRQKLILACALAVAVVAGVVVAVWPREVRYEGKPLSYWLDYLPVTFVSPQGHSSVWSASQYEAADFITMVWHRQQLSFIVWSNGVFGRRTSYLTAPPVSNAGVASPLSAIADRAVVEVGPGALPVLLERLRTRERHMTHLDQTLLEWRTRLHLRRNVQPGLPPWLEFQIKRGQAVTALLQLGDTAKPAIPQVLALAKSDPDPGVRASALEVLRRLSPGDYAQLTEPIHLVTEAAH